MPECVLSKLEILHIRFFNSKAPNGYNLTDGGDGWMSGTRHSLESRQRMSEVMTTEMRQKISEANKGKTSPMKGKDHSPETRRRISQSLKGRTSPMKGKYGKNIPLRPVAEYRNR